MPLYAGSYPEIDSAFDKLVESKAEALAVVPGSPFAERRAQIATLAARHAVPAIYTSREYTAVGGLISYGPVLAAEFREIGMYAGRILKGEKASDLPVLRPTKFELIINLQTARALRIVVPPTLLAQADEDIE